MEYPKEFIDERNNKYTLEKIYKYYGLYKSELGFRSCFNLETIKREVEKSGS